MVGSNLSHLKRQTYDNKVPMKAVQIQKLHNRAGGKKKKRKEKRKAAGICSVVVYYFAFWQVKEVIFFEFKMFW